MCQFCLKHQTHTLARTRSLLAPNRERMSMSEHRRGERIGLDEAVQFLELCGHDVTTFALLNDCECDYCVSEREDVLLRARRIKGRLRDHGWVPPKGESEQTHLMLPKTMEINKDGANATF